MFMAILFYNSNFLLSIELRNRRMTMSKDWRRNCSEGWKRKLERTNSCLSCSKSLKNNWKRKMNGNERPPSLLWWTHRCVCGGYSVLECCCGCGCESVNMKKIWIWKKMSMWLWIVNVNESDCEYIVYVWRVSDDVSLMMAHLLSQLAARRKIRRTQKRAEKRKRLIDEQRKYRMSIKVRNISDDWTTPFQWHIMTSS